MMEKGIYLCENCRYLYKSVESLLFFPNLNYELIKCENECGNYKLQYKNKFIMALKVGRMNFEKLEMKNIFFVIEESNLFLEYKNFENNNYIFNVSGYLLIKNKLIIVDSSKQIICDKFGNIKNNYD